MFSETLGIGWAIGLKFGQWSRVGVNTVETSHTILCSLLPICSLKDDTLGDLRSHRIKRRKTLSAKSPNNWVKRNLPSSLHFLPSIFYISKYQGSIFIAAQITHSHSMASPTDVTAPTGNPPVLWGG